ncbi:NifU family protein [Allobaculum mucilyticum]|uniref:NifU family protein n=1 Tax=Allobaculum mucilyticum TaxID=2834459 RepID=UPI001E3CCC53|nr:NifU family protein [Allobaculum mucilyticum]UNT95941.1 NifU family protein [Allobaculum mucilyticum]
MSELDPNTQSTVSEETSNTEKAEEAAPAESAQEQKPVKVISEDGDGPIEIKPLKEGEKLTRKQRNAWEERAEQIVEKIRPYIQMDGGDVQLLGIDEDGIAYVTFLGACAGCMMAGEDFSTGIRLLLLDEFPELREVVLVGA